MGGVHQMTMPELKNFRMAFPLWLLLCVMIALGAVCLYLVASHDSTRAWFNMLICSVMFLGFGLCGLFLLIIQNVVGAHWSVSIRRIFEAMALTLPISAILIGIVYFGHHSLYEWSHPEAVAKDHLLQHKSGYLNSGFFGARLLVYFVIWIGSMLFLVSNSMKQDKTGAVELTKRNQFASALLLILFALSVCAAGFDLLMSLEPHWFSTIYGVFYFATFFQAGWAVIYLASFTLYRGGYLSGFVNQKHFHDVGKYVFAFSIFWAYIAFSQFMLYWYGDLPEETFWYKVRMNDGWEWMGLAVLALRWVVPFLVLLPYGNKMNFKIAVPVCVLVLFGNWLDLFWNAMPAIRFFSHGAHGGHELVGGFHWQELFVGLGFVGFFFLCLGVILQWIRLVPIRDPRLMDSIHHH